MHTKLIASVPQIPWFQRDCENQKTVGGRDWSAPGLLLLSWGCFRVLCLIISLSKHVDLFLLKAALPLCFPCLISVVLHSVLLRDRKLVMPIKLELWPMKT